MWNNFKKYFFFRKTPGSDNITSEVIKCDFDNIILEFSNKLLNNNVIQDQWSEIDLF